LLDLILWWRPFPFLSSVAVSVLVMNAAWKIVISLLDSAGRSCALWLCCVFGFLSYCIMKSCRGNL
jgi:hypothetical protein